MSLELETLDQLLGGDMPLEVIAGLYPSEKAFAQAVHALLRNGDVRLRSLEGTEVPRWRWRELFEERGVEREMRHLRLAITDEGALRIS